jgi:hypothetical protein
VFGGAVAAVLYCWFPLLLLMLLLSLLLLPLLLPPLLPPLLLLLLPAPDVFKCSACRTLLLYL